MSRSIVAEAVDLFFTSIVLWALNPVIAQAFEAGLADPSFAKSAAAPLWRLAASFFDF